MADRPETERREADRREEGDASRILFACLPATGLLNPLLAVAAEVNRRRSADLWFASTDEVRADVLKAGGDRPFTFVPLGPYHQDWPNIWSAEQLDSMSRGKRLRALVNFLRLNIDHDNDRRQYDRMLGVIDEVAPDLMVVDMNTTWAIDAAQTKGVPYVLSMPMPASSVFIDRLPPDYPTPFSGLPREMTARQRRRNRMFRAGIKLMFFRPSSIGATLDAVQRRKKAGLANATGVASAYADAAKALIGYSVFDFEYLFPAAPAHLTMVGSAVPPQTAECLPGTDLGAWLAGHESVVYIGFGTIMRMSPGQVAAILAAVARLGDRHAVLWKLPAAQRGLLPPAADLPANLRLEEWVPSQVEVLAHPHVRVFFNHGGGNAVHEALHFGKPLLVLPFWTDCHDLAARVVDRGVGLAVPNVEAPDVEEIYEKLARLLAEDGFRERAGKLGERIRAAGGVGTAARIIGEAVPAARNTRASV
jgi:polyene glycosyltransferase